MSYRTAKQIKDALAVPTHTYLKDALAVEYQGCTVGPQLRLNSKGQITIPAAVRRHLGVEKNQSAMLSVEPDGTVRLGAPRYPNVASLQGVVPALGTQLAWKDTLAIVHEGKVNRARRA